MISRETIQALARQPTVLSEVLLNLSTETFIELYGDARPNESHPLDGEEIVAAILQRGDAGKKLALARYAKLGGWLSPATPEQILALAQVSPAHKCALLANPRVDWYSFDGLARDDVVTKELLVPTLCADDAATHAFIANPRANRRLIATAIRGQAPFEGLDVLHRLRLGFGAVRADYVDSPHYPGKDAPDSNELDYDKPNRAFLAILRKHGDAQPAGPGGLEDLAPAVFDLLREPTWLVRPRRHHEKLAIDSDDWLLPEDKAEVDAISDWTAKHSRSEYLAGQRLAEWSAHIGKTAPLAPSETQEWFNFEGGIGNLAVLLATKGLQVSRVAASLHAGSARASTQQSAGAKAPLPQAWATSTNWIAQAALAVSEFEAQAQREWDPKKREAIAVNVVRQHAGHAAAAIRGLAVSGTFRGIVGSSHEVRKALGVLAQDSPEAATALKYVDDTHNGLFVRGVYDDSIDERAASEEAAEQRNAEQEAAAQREIELLSRELKELSRKIQLGQRVTTWGFLILAGTLFFLRGC